MTRRRFLLTAGLGVLLTPKGIKAAILGPKLGEHYRNGGREFLVVRNDSGKVIEGNRCVRHSGYWQLLGYYDGKADHMFGVTTEQVAPGQTTAIIISGYANVEWLGRSM